MTKNEFCEKYKDCRVSFNNYYKFKFTFSGSVTGGKLFVDVGGNADEIYRMFVDRDTTYDLKELDITDGYVRLDSGCLMDSFTS